MVRSLDAPPSPSRTRAARPSPGRVVRAAGLRPRRGMRMGARALGGRGPAPSRAGASERVPDLAPRRPGRGVPTRRIPRAARPGGLHRRREARQAPDGPLSGAHSIGGSSAATISFPEPRTAREQPARAHERRRRNTCIHKPATIGRASAIREASNDRQSEPRRGPEGTVATHGLHPARSRRAGTPTHRRPHASDDHTRPITAVTVEHRTPRAMAHTTRAAQATTARTRPAIPRTACIHPTRLPPVASRGAAARPQRSRTASAPLGRAPEAAPARGLQPQSARAAKGHRTEAPSAHRERLPRAYQRHARTGNPSRIP